MGDHIQDLSLICLLLLDVLPNLKIEGVDYLDLELLEGTKHEHLLLDDGSPLKLEAGEIQEIMEDKVKVEVKVNNVTPIVMSKVVKEKSAIDSVVESESTSSDVSPKRKKTSPKEKNYFLV